MTRIYIKRAYEPASPSDGVRVLVDRIWPRGITKAEAAIDEWAKALAPSTELRKWFGHDPAHWDEFQKRYAAELDQHAMKLDELRERAKKRKLTLVYGAKDSEHNQAVVLRRILEEGLGK
jgi:uncharacterized protein YeaO (DUF488 family)